jgi:hypothetical protein
MIPQSGEDKRLLLGESMPGLSGFFATPFIKTISAELGPNVKFGNGETASVKRAAIIAG